MPSTTPTDEPEAIRRLRLIDAGRFIRLADRFTSLDPPTVVSLGVFDSDSAAIAVRHGPMVANRTARRN